MNCVDHHGITYSSFSEMCKSYDKDPTLVRARLRYNWDLQTALETEAGHYNAPVFDHLGREFANLYTMCKHYNIDKSLYFSRLSKHTMTLEQILTTPPHEKEKECTDHLGNVFKSKSERARAYGLNSATVSTRLNNNKSLAEALCKQAKKTHKIGDMEFKNVREAGKYFNLSRTTIAKVVNETNDPIKRLEHIEQIKRSPAYHRWLEKVGSV